MLTYKAAYTSVDDGWVHAEVVDFPGAVSQGRGLDDARTMLADALSCLAEAYLSQGKAVPLPDPRSKIPDTADREEEIHLLLSAGTGLAVQSPRLGAPDPAVPPKAAA